MLYIYKCYTSTCIQMVYNLQKIQSLPLLKSTQECTQEVNSENIVSSSTCKEMHTFRPFSRGSSGASTEVEQELTFTRKSRGTNTRQGTRHDQSLFLYKQETDIFNIPVKGSRRHFYQLDII